MGPLGQLSVDSHELAFSMTCDKKQAHVVSHSITKERTEVVLQGTSSLDPNDPAAVWEEYDFKCKPGDLKRRPCFITPYHYRLDWLMWFAAFQVCAFGCSETWTRKNNLYEFTMCWGGWVDI